ncbi:E3 SUMO-protein ligase ZBED1-like [Branchiostoma floridae x Branchiostoma belcheri]
MPPRRLNPSKVWDHVKKLPQDKAKCKLCGTEIVCAGGTSNIARHLRRHHNIEATPHPASSTLTAMFGERNNNVQVSQSQTTQPQPASNLSVPASGGMPVLPQLPTLPSTSGSSSTVASTSRGTATSATVTPFTLSAKLANAKMPPEKQHQITGRLCHYIVKALRPYSIVDDQHFRAFVNELNPSYKIPGRCEVSERFIPKMYEVALLALKAEMKGVDCAALTGDGWTSRTADHYLTLTVHYLSGWDLQVKVLQTLKADVSQTGENIAAEVSKCLDDFGLTGKVHVMTTDNAKAMVNAIASAGISLSLNCFAHTLNLATQKAMLVPTVVTMLSVIRPVVTYFRNSYLGKVVLQEKQKALNKPTHALILDCKTRWNSAYMMVERFVEQYPAIVAASLDDRVKKKDSFKKLQRCSDQDIDRMERFLAVLKLPYKMTVAMSSEKRATSGQVLPLLDKLEQHLVEKADDDKFIKDIKGAIRKDLVTRYQEETRREFLEEASALDPRFKGSAVVTEDVWDRIADTIEVCQAQDVQVKEEPVESAEPVPVADREESEDTPANAKKAKLTAMEEIFEDEDEDVVVTHVQPPVPVRLRVQAEMHKYKSLPRLKSTDDVIAFWQGKGEELPLLSKQARKYLVVPGTSVPSERVFSTAGDIVSAERSKLDPDSVNMLLFLNKNT